MEEGEEEEEEEEEDAWGEEKTAGEIQKPQQRSPLTLNKYQTSMAVRYRAVRGCISFSYSSTVSWELRITDNLSPFVFS